MGPFQDNHINKNSKTGKIYLLPDKAFETKLAKNQRWVFKQNHSWGGLDGKGMQENFFCTIFWTKKLRL